MASPKKTDNQADRGLNELRAVINRLDDIIIRAVARRMVVSGEIGALKKLNKLKIKDLRREKELEKFHRALAKKYGITYATLEKIFKLIMKESKRISRPRPRSPSIPSRSRRRNPASASSTCPPANRS
jgi:chorismate mutase